MRVRIPKELTVPIRVGTDSQRARRRRRAPRPWPSRPPSLGLALSPHTTHSAANTGNAGKSGFRWQCMHSATAPRGAGG